MAMNREQKRMLRRQGDWPRTARPRPEAATPTRASNQIESHLAVPVRARGPRRAAQGRLGVRDETINFSIIVLVTVVLLTVHHCEPGRLRLNRGDPLPLRLIRFPR